MSSPELLVSYLRTLNKVTVQLPAPTVFPSMIVVGIRGNQSGRPRGIEADFLQFVATGRAQFPGESWPQVPITANTMRYDGERIIVSTGDDELWFTVDKSCKFTRHSATAPPDDFNRLTDPDLLSPFLEERPHTSTQLSLEMQVPQMEINREKPAMETASLGRKAEPRLYDRPSPGKTIAWLVVGIIFVAAGVNWLALEAKRGAAFNILGWALIVIGAVLIVRRLLDLFFPPSRL